jgi:diguanylate cyclase (GGDEF)-like protein
MEAMAMTKNNLPVFSRYLWLAVSLFVIHVGIFIVYFDAEKQVDRANERRLQSFQLAEELRHSSDDLTRMVRTYVATGNPIHKQHYQEILDIRDGSKPRPLDYYHVYWDLVLANDQRPRPFGPAVPLQKLMLAADFTTEELAKLTEAKLKSDVLTRTEMAAMALIESISPVPDEVHAKAITMLYGPAYIEARAGIMQLIDEFVRMTDQRTVAAVRDAKKHAVQLRVALILFASLLVFVVWKLRQHFEATLGGTLSALHARLARLGSGDFATTIPVDKGREGSVMGWLAETQASLARIDEQHRSAEARNLRLSRLYATLSECNQAIVRCHNEEALLARICRIAVTCGDLSLASFSRIERIDATITPLTWFSLDPGYANEPGLTAATALLNNTEPAAVAIDTGQPCWIQNVEDESVTAKWRECAGRYGWQSAALIPLCHNDEGSLLFTVLAPIPDAFDEDVRKLIMEMMSNIEYALKRFDLETQRSEAERRSQYLAYYDALTGLPNRIQLEDRARSAIGLARDNKLSMALMFLDLDHFKDINDSLGHSIGDGLLVELSKRLVSILREIDTVTRLGGDEFIFLLPGVDAQGAAQVAQKVLEVAARPYRVGPYDLNVTGSIGIALHPDDGSDLEILLKNADAAMYRAKQEGRDCYRYFTAEMLAQSARNLQLANALRQAVQRNQLEIYYQPQVSIHDQRIIGAEALLRWTHPDLGPISPAEFIPAAEDSGLILSIGEWVLRHAVRQAKSWRQEGLPPLIMAVNLSVVQFRHPDLPNLITQILDEEGLPPEYLELELTEGGAMDSPPSAMAVMDKLHERGVRMSIDDFGTGHSSLSYLKKFKVYKLKIDRSFVRDISTDPEDRAIVTAIIQLANNLGLQTTAEGVETAGQLAFLQEQGCNEVQGYYYSIPLPADQFKAFVHSSARNRTLIDSQLFSRRRDA